VPDKATTTLSILEFLASLPPSETLLVYPSMDGSVPPPPPPPPTAMAKAVSAGGPSSYTSSLATKADTATSAAAMVRSPPQEEDEKRGPASTLRFLTPSPPMDVSVMLAGADTVAVKAQARKRWQRMQSRRAERDSDDEEDFDRRK
jgi:hypothetical protein